jgi:mRNA-degrading endonuclease RelE of RelBE toxin-antitoxin system
MNAEFKLILSNKFDKTFSQLDRVSQKRIVESLKDLSKNPKSGRILYDIQENHLIIVVIAMGHRRNVYV